MQHAWSVATSSFKKDALGFQDDHLPKFKQKRKMNQDTAH
jgi:hypothetical protein